MARPSRSTLVKTDTGPLSRRPPAFDDRHSAGRQLLPRIEHLRESDPVVLALPRGGVPLGYEFAIHLGAPLDLVLVRKIAVPSAPGEYLGTVIEGGLFWFHEEQVQRHHLRTQELDGLVQRELQELEAEERRYRKGRPRLEVRDRNVIVVDDGVDTGSTARTALRAVRRREPARVCFVAGVISQSAIASLYKDADEVIAGVVPTHLRSIREWYRSYPRVSEEEIDHLLQQIWEERVEAPTSPEQVSG